MRPTSAPREPAVLDQPHCTHCHSAITLHQPDKDLPGRLLGICEECKRWYLMDAVCHLLLALPGHDRVPQGD